LSVFSGPPPDDEPDDIQPDELPSFPLFDAMVKALNAAGATYLAEGLWHLERFDWGPPVWDGFVLVPCDEDVVRRLLAGFATIGYVPRSPVDPQIYADPGNLPDDDAAGDDFLRKDGDDPGDIVFQPEKRDLSRGLFEVLVQPPEKFHLEATGAGEEQCAPGVSVRIPDTALTDGRVASWRCPQRIRDVALLSTIWMRELVPEGCRAVDTPEIVSTYESRLSPQPETGVSLPRFTRITSALSNAGVRYTIIGHWNFDQRDDPPLYWTGHLELPLRPRDVNDAFAALAAVGYAPRVDVSAQAFLEGPRHDYWSAARGMSRSREQVLTFVDPSPGWARLLVVGLEWPDFCDNHDRASLEEVAPGVLAPVLNFELVVGTAARDCPQRLADVAALDAGWRKAADDEAAGGSLVPTRGRKGVPHPSYPVPERELGPGLSLELYEQVARALHAADARYVLNGSWLVWVESEAAVIWIGDLVVPRRVAAAATAFTSLASLGYAPEPPMSAQEFACWEPAPRWVDLMAGRDTLPRLRFVNAEHPAFAIRVTAIESSRFERLEAIARIEEAGRGVPVITRNLMSDGLVQSWCPQCIAEVRRLRDAMDAGLRQVLLEKWLALCGEAEDTADET
jgi:hypothetical protein